MILVSIRRRRKEIRYVSIVAFVATFFMAGIILFQEAMNWLVMEQNYQHYGNWVISSTGTKVSHPYLGKEGAATISGLISGEWVETTTPRGEAKTEFSGYSDIEVGIVDQNLIELGNIRLYEGRMPETNDEIAADLPALSRMGYDYDLGQEITLMFQTEVKSEDSENEAQTIIIEKTYTLVGTLYSFATTWRTSSSLLPRLVITEEELETYEDFGRVRTTWFYQLDPLYEKVDTMEMYEGIKTEYGGEELNYNSFVYANQLWGSAESFRNVSQAMILIAVIAIGYLLSSYTGKRRSVYYRYRCMGSDIWQVRQMILVECLYATLPAALIGLVLAYVAGFAGCGLTAAQKNLPNFFRFDGEVFLWQMGSILLILLVSVGWSVFGIRDKKLVQGTSAVPVKKLAGLGRFVGKSKQPEKDFIKRYNRLHAVSYRLSIVFSILMCSIIVLCGNQLNYQFRIKWQDYKSAGDYWMMEGPTNYRYVLPNSSGYAMETATGFDAAAIDELANIWGVESAVSTHYDDAVYMVWDGWENSELLRWEAEHKWGIWYDSNKEYDSPILHYQNTKANYLKNREAMLMGLKYVGVDKGIDWDAWENGEQIIVSLKTEQFDAEKEAYVDIIDTTIKAGDVVEVRSYNEEYSKTVTIAAVYHDNGEIGNAYRENGYSYSNNNITIWASPAFAAHFMKPEQPVIVANDIRGNFDQMSSFEATDKQVARYSVEHKVRHYDTSGAEYRRMTYQEIIQTVTVYGALAMMLLTVFMVLQRNFADSRNRYRTEQYRLLRKIGMEEKYYLKIAMKAEAKEYAWIFISIPIGYLMDMIFVYAPKYRQGAFIDSFSELLNKWDPGEYWMALDYVVLQINHCWTAAGVVLVFGLLMGNTWLLARQYMRQIRQEMQHKK